MLIPKTLRDLIDPTDALDPIRRQFVPSNEEHVIAPEDRADPIGDAAYASLAGLVHRYPNRVLLKPTMTCPVHCRFCFRRGTVGGGEWSEVESEAALAYIADRPAINEAILTGGDPLMLPPARLSALIARLAAIPHIEVVRIHTRVPIAAPQRVGKTMTAALNTPPNGPALWLAVHVNHARELTPAARAALARLADAGLPLVSQTVLLKGVNDSVEALDALFRALLRQRVKPYYLHHPDLVPGTAHFRPTIDEGRALMRDLRARLSGIAQPTYVLDIPGGAGKVPIGPEWWDGGQGEVTGPDGGRHPYPG